MIIAYLFEQKVAVISIVCFVIVFCFFGYAQKFVQQVEVDTVAIVSVSRLGLL